MAPQVSVATSSPEQMTIDDVAIALHVSTASVRNWIKTGYLNTQNGRYISRSSFEVFKDSIVGTEKLTKRANKSNFDSHDHKAAQAEYLKYISQWKSNDLETAGVKYESTLSNSYRNKEGIYYTPEKIIDRFFDFIEGDVSDLIFCDPCCGSGNFIVAALNRGFLPENIYGFDIDPVAIEITKARIKSKTGIDHHQIYLADFLQDVVLSKTIDIPACNVVLTNPPWGKKLDKDAKEKFALAFECPKNTDTAALFLRAALQHASNGAIIGMLLPESFFNISIFSTTRELVAEQRILGCIDFGKPFKGLLTKAKGIILQKTQQTHFENNILCEVLDNTHTRKQNSFQKNPMHIFNFACSDSDASIIEHLYRLPHLTLSGQTKWGLGIVTGNNKKFVKSFHEDNHIPVFKGAEITRGALPEPQYFIPENLSLYQQVAPKELYFAPEKLIYRFISSKLVFHHDTKSTVFLNSANMLILGNDFGITHKNLAWLFNTQIMNWLFSKIFDTHKILRSDLETLPVFHEFFNSSLDTTEANLLKYLNIEINTDGTYRRRSGSLSYQ